MNFKIFKIGFWKYSYVIYRTSNLIEKGYFKQAIDILENYLNTKEFITETIYYWLGSAYLGNKSFELAEKSLRVSIENQSDDDVYKANTYYLLGLVFYEEEKYDKSIIPLKKAISIKETLRSGRDVVISLSNLYLLLGKSYFRTDDKENAIQSYKRGLEIDNDNIEIKNALSAINK